jgi:predicted Zn finger-like uncharacterized protein
MIIQCKSCERKFVVKDLDIPESGRVVKCGYCSVTWHQKPTTSRIKDFEKALKNQPVAKTNEYSSADRIKASDGKIYKFLGTQWAHLLPSGKTGLFAKKKISKELNKITGKEEIKITKRRPKNISEVNPSSEMFESERNLPDIYSSKKNLGFFGYVFLIIIVAFSIIGFFKTFEDDLLNYFPESQYIFEFFNQQLIFLSESIKNVIVIAHDLLNSY